MDTAEDIPLETRLAGAEAVAQRDKQFASDNVQLSETLRQLKDEYRKEIRSLIGTDKQAAYQEFHTRTKQRLTELQGSMRHTTEGLKAASEVRKQMLVEARQYVSKLGIDVKKVEEIQRRYATQASSAVTRTFLTSEEAPYVEIDPAAVLTAGPTWQWRKPPYLDQSGRQYSNGTRGRRTVSHYENRITGEMESNSTMNISGADDSDWSHTVADTEFRFWFRMPAAGLVEVWIHMQSVWCSYSGCLDDEFGYSSASITVNLLPYLRILTPLETTKYATLIDYHRGGEEGCWSGIVAPTGEFRYAHLFSRDVYAAGQFVLCGVGIHSNNYFSVNDMSCHSAVFSNWFIQQVAVRSTGAS